MHLQRKGEQEREGGWTARKRGGTGLANLVLMHHVGLTNFSVLQLLILMWRISSALPQKRAVHFPGRAIELPKAAFFSSKDPANSLWLLCITAVAVIPTKTRSSRQCS